MRDMRDPAVLGVVYLDMRSKGVSIGNAVGALTPNVRPEENCIERYGRPQDLKPKFMEVQVK